MSSNYTIRKVETKADLKRFIDFPHDLYAGDPYYVPELYIAQEALLDRKKNPYFEHAEADYFLATENGSDRVVGRIAATINQAYLEFTQHQAGFFGFFDSIDNQTVASALLHTAKAWITSRGFREMVGPCNFSTNETCGTLIENFDRAPYLLCTYNYPYYAKLLEQFGLKKYTDLVSYELSPELLTPKMSDTAALLKTRLASRGVTIRDINMKDFDNEIQKFLEIYNASWDKNLGFVPMTPNEVRAMGKDLKSIVDPEFVYFAEKDGKPIGLALNLPNFNDVLQKVKRGRLLPTGIFKILLGKGKIRSVRTVALGILPEYRRTGLDMCFYVRSMEVAKRKGIVHAEASWILEDNLTMNRALVAIGGQVYRKHRIYSIQF
jgi:GNAT superfamily N-acetyltransferase